MRGFTSLPRPLLLALATLLAAATVVYGVLWMYYARHAEPTALLGIEYDYLHEQHALRITEVAPGTAAAQASLQPGDTILAINGRTLDTLGPLYDDIIRGRPGDRVTLTINRPDRPAPFKAQAVLNYNDCIQHCNDERGCNFVPPVPGGVF